MYQIVAAFGSTYKDNIPLLVVSIIATVLATAVFTFVVAPIHNNIQALVAYRCGDDKAKERCFTKNPLMSFHWIGAISALVLQMGFCEPIFVKREKLKHPVLNTILIQIIGPVFYALFSLIPILLCSVLSYMEIYGISGVNYSSFDFLTQGASPFAYVYIVILLMLYFLYKICFFSAVLNLLPIPPLDTSRILLMTLSYRWERSIINNETLISAGLVIAMFLSIGKPGGVLYNICYTGISIVYILIRQFVGAVAGLFGG